MADDDRLAEVRDRVERSAFHSDLFRMFLERVDEGRVEVALVVRSDHRNLVGTVHGGVIATLADTATGLAYRTVLPAGFQHVTSQLNVTFLAPAREGKIVAKGVVVKQGKRSGYAEADVLGSDGTLLARATALFALLPERTDT